MPSGAWASRLPPSGLSQHGWLLCGWAVALHLGYATSPETFALPLCPHPGKPGWAALSFLPLPGEAPSV